MNSSDKAPFAHVGEAARWLAAYTSPGSPAITLLAKELGWPRDYGMDTTDIARAAVARLAEHFAPLRPVPVEPTGRKDDDGKLRVLYLAHPVSGDVAANVERAKRWLRWAARAFAGCAVIAPWLLALELGDDDTDPAQREANLRRCEATAARCDAVLWVGGRVSTGMAREGKVASAIIDLTALGEEPPT